MEGHVSKNVHYLRHIDEYGVGEAMISQLRKVRRLGLEESAHLEAQFYLLSHTSSDTNEAGDKFREYKPRLGL